MAATYFVIFLLLFAGIGAASAIKSRGTTEDYYLAGKRVAPWLAGLSAVATNNSGYMFIGMIGTTYTIGWSSIWLMIGWIIGDLLANLALLSRLQTVSETQNVQTYSQLLSKWNGIDFASVRKVSAALTLLFLCVYAAAQLKAGGKALHVIFDWPVEMGAVLGAVIVLIYSIAGGIRASIWTDAAQSFVMLGAMGMLAWSGLNSLGGWTTTLDTLGTVSPTYMNWFGEDTVLNAICIIFGWFAGGVAVLGQPHIMVRFIALDNRRSLTRMRLWYYGWFTAFYGATIFVGLLTRLIIPETTGFDAELALPHMAQQLLSAPFIGLVLAGLFAATMSTADSLVLACSSAISVDLSARNPTLARAKIATTLVVIFSFLIAISGNKSVFRLVLDAWGMLGSAFAPLLLLLAAGRILSERVSIGTIAIGLGTFIGWEVLGLGAISYGVLPGILVGLSFGYLFSGELVRRAIQRN